MIYTYSANALVYNSLTNKWSLKTGYDHTVDRVQLEVWDDDQYLDGDYGFGANEVGSDSNQTGTVRDMDGNLIATGRIYDEQFYEIAKPGGGVINIERIEINGQHVGYIVTEPLVEGTDYTQTATGDVKSALQSGGVDSRLAYSEVQAVPCFGPGVMIDTENGSLPVDWLATGDRLLTLDHGYQPILWIGRTRMRANDMAACTALRPVTVPADRFGPDGPIRDLVLSPEHRVLVASARIELATGNNQALAPCRFLFATSEQQADAGPFPDDFCYYHVLLARHEIIRAEGLWVESFFPGPMAMKALPPGSRRQIHRALGGADQTNAMPTARYVLNRRECVALGLDTPPDTKSVDLRRRA